MSDTDHLQQAKELIRSGNTDWVAHWVAAHALIDIAESLRTLTRQPSGLDEFAPETTQNP